MINTTYTIWKNLKLIKYKHDIECFLGYNNLLGIFSSKKLYRLFSFKVGI